MQSGDLRYSNSGGSRDGEAVNGRQRQLIRQGLTDGKSQADIARQLGLPSSTVNEIAQSLRDEGPFLGLDQPVRCSGCGVLIETDPCVACTVRNNQSS